MAKRRQLTFLIGAHKTASTHLQRSVTRSRKALAPHGLGVIGPMPIGADILPLSGIMRGRADPALLALAADGFLVRETGEAETVVLMNENILGSLEPKMLLRDDRLYKFAPGRLKRVLQLFPDHQLSVGMAIRAPASFLISAWQEDMKGHPFGSFRNYLGQTDLKQLFWHRLVKRMQQAIGDIPFFVWRYEDYPAIAPLVLHHVMGDAGAAVSLPQGAANPGFSAAALDYLEQIGQVTKETTAEALKRFPKGPDFPGFAPWTKAERADLDRLYTDDCAQMADLAGVTLITP